MLLFFLSSGLFLGWSLGANDAANVFGTAVGTRMIRFRTAAMICSAGVILGAVLGGAGASHTLGKLGAVNAIAGSFMVALAAAFTVFWMTKLRLPVSTSQAIVGAIIGWNFFSGSLTDMESLTKIGLTWIVCPILSAIFAMVLYKMTRTMVGFTRLHLFRIDSYTRTGLILVGAFGSYSLGANNIANVVGVFVPVSPFNDLNVYGWFTLSGTQQLFLLGGIAIAIGVFTYSRRVMETVGGSLLHLYPEAAFIVVMSQALVLFLFSSEGLENWLIQIGLPPIPLVPVSSSQAVIGAVIGIGIIRGGGRNIRFKVLVDIATGWVTTPIMAGILTFVALFFLQNVFGQQVSRKVTYQVTTPVMEYLQLQGIDTSPLQDYKNKPFPSGIAFGADLKINTRYTAAERKIILKHSRMEHFFINRYGLLIEVDKQWLSPAQLKALQSLVNQHFQYDWQLLNRLADQDESWRLKPDTKTNKPYNKEIKAKQEYMLEVFRSKNG